MTDSLWQVDSGASRRGRFLKTLALAPVAIKVSIAVVVVYTLAAVFARYIAPFGETELVTAKPFGPWDGTNLLGTDQLGRDIFSRIIYGAQNSIGIAVLTTAIAFVVGGSLGALAAICRGWIDQFLGRFVDVLMAIPQLIFALMLLSIFGSSIPNVIVIIAVLDSTRVFRLTRALAMDITTLDYIESAQVRGETLFWIVCHEILPNIRAILLAEFGLRFCFVFLTISSLSFLGLGIEPPTADWGSMVRETGGLIAYGDVTPLIPAAAIAILTVAINFIVDWYLQLAGNVHD